MTARVDFYVLQKADQSAHRFACQLALKAWQAGTAIRVSLPTPGEVQSLDALMWSYPPLRFLPHELAETGCTGQPGAPIVIGTAEQILALASESAALINLTPTAIMNPGQFGRILEIVPYGEAERSASRIKFSHYRTLGLDPTSHEIKVDTSDRRIGQVNP